MPRQKTMYLELGEVPSLIDKYKPASIPIPLNDPSYLQPPGKKENGIEATVIKEMMLSMPRMRSS